MRFPNISTNIDKNRLASDAHTTPLSGESGGAIGDMASRQETKGRCHLVSLSGYLVCGRRTVDAQSHLSSQMLRTTLSFRALGTDIRAITLFHTLQATQQTIVLLRPFTHDAARRALPPGVWATSLYSSSPESCTAPGPLLYHFPSHLHSLALGSFIWLVPYQLDFGLEVQHQPSSIHHSLPGRCRP